MKKKKKLQLLSLGASFIMLCSVVGCRSNVNSNRDNNEEPVIEEVVEEEPVNIIYEPYYYNDTSDIDSAVNSLGINRNDSFPYESYRYVRFVDNDNYEKFAIAVGYVDYVTNDGNVVDTVYNYYDAFNGNFLFSTKDYRDVKNIQSDVILYLMDFGKLLDLKDCVISKGLNSDYANSVINNSVKNKMLSTYDVARIFVLLVNSNNRFENNNQMIMG